MTQSSEAAIEKTKDAIEETRNKVRDRVNSLQDDLSPAALLDRFAPEGQPLSESIRQVADAARRNPLATALLAGGAMLLGREVLSGSHNRFATYADEKDAAARVGKHIRSVKSATADIAQTASQMTESARRKAADGVDSAAETAEDLLQTSKQQAQSAYKAANRAVRTTTTDTAKAATTGRRWVEDNPVAAGLACVAVGALAASFFTAKPISDYRDDDDEADDQPTARPAKKTGTASGRSVAKKRAVSKKSQPRKVKPAVSKPPATKTGKAGAKRKPAPVSGSTRPAGGALNASTTGADKRQTGYTGMTS